MKARMSKILSCVLAMAMLCAVAASASYNELSSSTASHSEGGYSFNYWSTLYYGSDSYASVWVERAGSYTPYPANSMAACASLYNSSGNAVKTSGEVSNTSADYFIFAYTSTMGGTGYHAGGYVKLATGSGLAQFTCPQTGTRSSSNSSRAALLSSLTATLDRAGNYPTNSNGETYGSGLLVEVVGDMPALISAENADGVCGYIRESDLTPATPAEAAAFMETLVRTIPLYDINDNVIGTYELDATITSYNSQFAGMSIDEVRATVANLTA
ncbi:MAG: hypothetical protein VB053_06375 [Oscillibacter ruminantium]|uniref:hypothetical protein n=1 Tax=Oscillibacter ruminantium TaxID=1263547 RepID=UPI002B1EF076|nr:hypothetical protein [Oscillibacter ruminantium]MEA5042154.1 hypothetical protein [Oscillibacter ruminantium]